MRYGALPVTRSVGGLADTVTDIDTAHPEGAACTGFTFDDPTAEALAGCAHRADASAAAGARRAGVRRGETGSPTPAGSPPRVPARPRTDFTVRIVPFHPEARVPTELPLIRWQA